MEKVDEWMKKVEKYFFYIAAHKVCGPFFASTFSLYVAAAAISFVESLRVREKIRKFLFITRQLYAFISLRLESFSCFTQYFPCIIHDITFPSGSGE